LKNFSLLDLLRIWAALTGLVLAAGYFAALFFGVKTPVVTMLPMLVAAIGGFELFLFSQDMWLRWRASRG
jgi:hypothetical protein